MDWFKGWGKSQASSAAATARPAAPKADPAAKKTPMTLEVTKLRTEFFDFELLETEDEKVNGSSRRGRAAAEEKKKKEEGEQERWKKKKSKKTTKRDMQRQATGYMRKAQAHMMTHPVEAASVDPAAVPDGVCGSAAKGDWQPAGQGGPPVLLRPRIKVCSPPPDRWCERSAAGA